MSVPLMASSCRWPLYELPDGQHPRLPRQAVCREALHHQPLCSPAILYFEIREKKI
jgi:hypothetical protein